jgi:hypothetical protein
MTPENIERLTTEIKENYSDVATAQDGNLTLVRLPQVHFPPGCEPASASAIVAFDITKPKPDFYLKVVPLVRGAQPQHGTIVVAGDSWCTFSYNLRWDEEHTAVQFVEGMLRRFA